MNYRLLIFFAVSAFVLSTGCRNQSGQGTKTPLTSATACLTGKWIYMENNFEKTFIFRADKTGAEVFSETEIRPYTWEIKDGKPTIIYKGETKEWSLTLICDKGELDVFGLKYRKKL